MNREELQRRAYQRMAAIEDKFAGHHVPAEIQQYWILQFAIAEGLRSFMTTYGFRLNVGDCNDGRQEMRWGPLSGFERDTIAILNEAVDHAEARFDRETLQSRNVRPIGIARG